MFYNRLVKPILFSLNAELAHELGTHTLRALSKSKPACSLLRKLLHSNHPVEAFGLKFPNCIGQAAGLDKNGVFPRASEALGFGFVEVGTVTPQAQPGNEKPRLFRLPKDFALVNRMGFNNDGLEALVEEVLNLYPINSRKVPLGINLGKGKSTPIEKALQDYTQGIDAVSPIADYITINISSPNTPGLRKLHNDEFLDPLLRGINEQRLNWASTHSHKPPPFLLKISPDESFNNLEKIITKAIENDFSGVIACNTSVNCKDYMNTKMIPNGGISGKPLETKSNEIIRFIAKLTDWKFPIIGSGGIYDYESAQRKLDAGATLLQIYTSFIYHGPLWPSKLGKRIPLTKCWP